MGYAIFTVRKLMLTNRINRLNFRIMQLSQQQQTLADMSGRMQQQQAMQQNMMSLYFNNMRNQSIMASMQQNCGQMNIMDSMAIQNYFNNMQMGTNQMMSMQNDGQLQNVAMQENQIELERKNLETQVKAATAELESVEKAEDSQIKASAPKFA